jgi:hypothetical protein
LGFVLRPCHRACQFSAVDLEARAHVLCTIRRAEFGLPLAADIRGQCYDDITKAGPRGNKATPAISGGTPIVRTRHHAYGIRQR